MGDPKLEKEKHIKYWQRCLRTVLPTPYTSTDSSRMTLGFFILSALDLLGAGADTFTEVERKNTRNWILKCQHPNGGFCGSPNHRYPDAYYTDVGEGMQQMDPANLPATYFAILSLAFVGDLSGVDRTKCLRWLKTLQRDDGSFGELVGQNGKIEGGRDMRYCYVATVIRWIFRGGEGEEEDIDVEKLVSHIRAGQTYDGGISESSQHEAHAGYTYCAIGSLSLLNRLPDSPNRSINSTPGLSNMPATIKWLVSRQVGYTGDDEGGDDDDDDDEDSRAPKIKLAGVYHEHPDVDQFVGFNGRCNKKVDTCYAFWVASSLDMLGAETVKLVNTEAIRRFLFQQSQHIIGGFGKYPGNPPDIYHSYLGLAALAVMKEPGVKSLDSALCISNEQRVKLKKLREAAVVPIRTRTYWKHGYCFSIREDDPDFEVKMAESEERPKDIGAILDKVAINQKIKA